MHRLRCAVPTCDNTHQNSDKKFLQAPRQDAIRNQWFKVLGVPISTDQNAFICEDHFKVEDKDQGYSEEDADSDGYTEQPPSPKTTKSTQLPPSPPSTVRETAKRKYCDAPSTHIETSKRQFISATPVYCKRETDEEDEHLSDRPLVIKSSDDESNGASSPTDPSSPTPVPEDGRWTEPSGMIIKEELDHNYGSSGVETASSEFREDVEVVIKMEPQDLSTLMNAPYLEILDQPEPSYRFRYKRESSKPHGPLKGRSHLHNGPRNSFGPKVKLCNFQGSHAILRVWLFCGDGPSPHQLVTTIPMEDRRGSQLMYEPHAVRVDTSNDFTVSFDKLNILHVVCGELEYQRRYFHKKVFSQSESFESPLKLPPFDQAEMKEEIRRKEKDIACLKIEAFTETLHGYRKICEVYSEDIRNKKSPKTNDLRILKQSHEEGSCRGNQQVFIFTEKLIKEVYVEFFEEDELGEVLWNCKASFKESDIHKQVAISFLTPPYRDLHIDKPVPVFFRLVRSTDGAVSFNRTYRYIPANCPCEDPSVGASLWPRESRCKSPTRGAPVDKATQCAFFTIQSSARPCNFSVPHPDAKLQRLVSKTSGGVVVEAPTTFGSKQCVKTYTAYHRKPVVSREPNMLHFKSVPKLVALSLPMVLDKSRVAPNALGEKILKTKMAYTKVYRIAGREATDPVEDDAILQNPLPTPVSPS